MGDLLVMRDDSRIVVVGVGNPYRRDDAAGIIAAKILKERVPDSVEVHENSGEVAILLELLRSSKAAIFIDTVVSGSEPGKIFRFDVGGERLPAKLFHLSSHSLGIAESIELSRTMHELPSTVIVYGIEGKAFGPGEVLSPEVEIAAGHIAERVAQDIREVCNMRG